MFWQPSPRTEHTLLFAKSQLLPLDIDKLVPDAKEIPPPRQFVTNSGLLQLPFKRSARPVG